MTRFARPQCRGLGSLWKEHRKGRALRRAQLGARWWWLLRWPLRIGSRQRPVFCAPLCVHSHCLLFGSAFGINPPCSPHLGSPDVNPYQSHSGLSLVASRFSQVVSPLTSAPYPSQEEFEKALVWYESTLKLQPEFVPAKNRIQTIQCHLMLKKGRRAP